jgi:hypothetical protein
MPTGDWWWIALWQAAVCVGTAFRVDGLGFSELVR